MKLRLIDDAKSEFHRLWSTRAALLFFALNGFLVGLAAFDKILNPFLYLGINIFGHMVVGALRYFKQPDKAPAQLTLELDGGAK